MKIQHLFFALSLGFLSACTAPPKGVEPISGFEAERYMGKWYEIARLDHSFERGLSDVTADYSLNEDGSIKVINRGIEAATCEKSEAEGHAEFLGSPDVASLKVTFFWPFSGGYHVIALDEVYSYALVVGPSFDYLWILSRTPQMDQALRDQLVEKAKSLGFETAELIIVDHAKNTC